MASKPSLRGPRLVFELDATRLADTSRTVYDVALESEIRLVFGVAPEPGPVRYEIETAGNLELAREEEVIILHTWGRMLRVGFVLRPTALGRATAKVLAINRSGDEVRTELFNFEVCQEARP